MIRHDASWHHYEHIDTIFNFNTGEGYRKL